MDIDERLVRGLPAPLYAVVYLPGGLLSGFVSVTLGFVLGRHGVGIGAVSTLVGLSLLPTTWSVVMGPMVDVSLTPRLWYGAMTAVLAACFAAFILVPTTAAGLPMLGLLCFVASSAAVCAGAAITAAMTLTTRPAERGPIAGWSQTANLGGSALGGGLGLWIAGHGGEAAVGIVLASLTVTCALPVLMMRIPARAAGLAVVSRLKLVARDLGGLARSRVGVLAIVIMLLPAALGASAGLLPAAAGHWRASADLVAVVRGALGALTTTPGCVLGGYLCRRYRHRTVYIVAALAYAGGLAAMALSPHTPLAFAAFVLLNGVLLGVAFAALIAINYDALGPDSPATVSAGLSSLSNVPLLAATVLLGQAEARLGVDGMLLTEAALGALSVAAYARLASAWRQAAPASSPASA